MGAIINLRRARKQKTRAGSEAEAASNRATFGRSRAEREAAIKLRDLEATRLGGHLRAAVCAPSDDDQE
jgi:hypothetical protein